MYFLGGGVYITVISTYVSTLPVIEDDKDKFYQQVSDLPPSIPSGYGIALLRDSHATTRADSPFCNCNSVIGHFAEMNMGLDLNPADFQLCDGFGFYHFWLTGFGLDLIILF